MENGALTTVYRLAMLGSLAILFAGGSYWCKTITSTVNDLRDGQIKMQTQSEEINRRLDRLERKFY
jgi:hypothetical protein